MAGKTHRCSTTALLGVGTMFLLVLLTSALLNILLVTRSTSGSGKALETLVAQVEAPGALVKHGSEKDMTKTGVAFGKKENIVFSELQNATQELRKRDPWNDAVAKGIDRITSLNGPRTETRWTRMTDLTGLPIMAENHGGGWQMETVDSGMYTAKGFDDAYRQLGINKADDQKVFANQFLRFSNCQYDDLEETGAQFINVYNVPGRTIVAAYNVHPVASTQGEPPININGQQVNWQQRLPNVQKWSDVTGIIWVDKAGSAVGNLKYVFRQAIVTDTTKATMNEAFERSGSRIGSNGKYEKRWPGYTYNAGSEEFAALLGTLHGTGVAFLVLTHPDELGGKNIESVQIFTTPDVNNDYHQLWTLSG